MQHRSLTTNTRFAWLTPINGQQNSYGPWLLTENHTRHPSQGDTEQRRVSVGSLLQMATTILTIPTRVDSTETQNCWKSQCGRFEIIWQKSAGEASRLFVQRAEDYFARIDIRVDGKLLVSFHEPVWPHLQKMTGETKAERLFVPTACLDAMEYMSAQASEKLINDAHFSQQISKAA